MKLVSYENASGTSWGILKGDHVLDGVALTKGTFPTLKAVLKADALNEIARQAAYIREWGGKFVVPIPEVTVF